VIQLESFIDIDRVEGVHTDKESIPNFKKYQEEYPSGFLTVPAIGAGTANTEFEILTGMNSKDFGAGEYPYKTILTSRPCESLAQILRRDGYSTHAIHNNRAKFYSRDEVYPNLGFETFTSLEYMTDIERTETNWAKDGILVDEIIKALNSTPGRDFVFTISVQGHGKYPKDELKCEEHIKVTRDDQDPELTNQFGYFVNQCYEMDEMIAELKAKLYELQNAMSNAKEEKSDET
jgi:phosphoglycerol transferase MdoB-like AlkP superfamily enzyme